jgi:DNA adenine methylase
MNLSAYYGGKGSHLKHLLPILEAIPHVNYVEIFGGLAALLLNKKPRKREVYNDLDDVLCALMRTVRTRPLELAKEVEQTPYAISEYKYCLEQLKKSDIDEMEKARCAWTLLKTTFNSSITSGGFSTGGRIYTGNIAAQLHNTTHFDAISKRLSGVVIENNDWQTIFDMYDAPDTLFYLDPPYHLDTRSGRAYRKEWGHEDYVNMVNRLSQCLAHVVLSGYEHPVYEPLELAGWGKFTYEALTMQANKGEGHKRAMECVWLSPTAKGYYQTTDLFSPLLTHETT